MKILALDSSTSVASVAFLLYEEKNSQILFRCHTPHKRSDSAALFEGFEAAIAICGLPDEVCVGLGPGSYNGLRAGIAAARAFATALEIPLLALASPLALPGPESGFWALGDARGGHYWIACIQDGVFLESPRLISPSEIMARLQIFPTFPVLSSTTLNGIENLQIATPDAGRLAILSKRADPIMGTPEPLYLKPPHITPSRTAVSGI